MQTKVLILDHHTSGRQPVGNVEVLLGVSRRNPNPLTKILLFTVSDEIQAIDRTNINTGIALDTLRSGENRLNIAIQTAHRLIEAELLIETELDLKVEIF